MKCSCAGADQSREIRSPVTRVIVDEERTAELKRIAASKVQKFIRKIRGLTAFQTSAAGFWTDQPD